MANFEDGFERPDPDWFLGGGAGFDYGIGLANKGQGNAWVRNTRGWNAINRFHPVRPRTWYRVGAYLRLSPSLTDGYFAVREARDLNGNGTIIKELKLVGSPPRAGLESNGYGFEYFDFFTGSNESILIYIGLWGIGRDAWIQIDDFVLGPRP